MTKNSNPQPCGETYLVTACGACASCQRRKAAKARRRAWRERVERDYAKRRWYDAMKG